VAIAKKRKQTDGSGREEQKCQNDEQQDAAWPLHRPYST